MQQTHNTGKKTRRTIKSAGSKTILAAAAVAALGMTQAKAATLFWDADTAGAANGGSGTWGAANVWSTDLAGTSHQAWSDGSDAFLPQSAGTITVAAPATVGTLE